MKSKSQKREEGYERNSAWAKLTDVLKIKSLDDRLGTGKGAKRQRKKLEPK